MSSIHRLLFVWLFEWRLMITFVCQKSNQKKKISLLLGSLNSRCPIVWFSFFLFTTSGPLFYLHKNITSSMNNGVKEKIEQVREEDRFKVQKRAGSIWRNFTSFALMISTLHIIIIIIIIILIDTTFSWLMGVFLEIKSSIKPKRRH